MNRPRRPMMTTTSTNTFLADNSTTAVQTTNDHWHGQTRTWVEGHRMRTQVDEDKEPKTRHLTCLGPLVCFFISFHITITLLTTFFRCDHHNSTTSQCVHKESTSTRRVDDLTTSYREPLFFFASFYSWLIFWDSFKSHFVARYMFIYDTVVPVQYLWICKTKKNLN